MGSVKSLVSPFEGKGCPAPLGVQDRLKAY